MVIYNCKEKRKKELNMKELVEMIGKTEGYSVIDIHNCYGRIDHNITKLVRAGLNVTTNDLIVIAIEYSTSLKLQREYKNVLNYVQEIL